MNNWKKKLIWILPAVLVLGGVVWWMTPKSTSPELRYTTATVERGSLTQTVSANGTLNPVILVSVGTQVSGIVQKLHADFNDRVEAGQILLELDPSLIRAQLQQSEASVANAKAALELAQANEARMRNLFQREYVSRQDLDQTVQALKAAQAQLKSAEAQVQRDRANLGYTVIRSPVSGVVVSRGVDIGQTVAASFQTPTLFTIAQDLSSMQIDTSFAEADIGSIKEGQRANFRVDAFPNRVFDGVVHQVRLNPTTNQNVVTYNVVISVKNPELILLPGMTAYVNIIVANSENALLVPNAALRFRPVDAGLNKAAPQSSRTAPSRGGAPNGAQGKPNNEAKQMGTLYILENGQAKAVRVPIGITDNRTTEILGNSISEGTQVIVEDRLSLNSGNRGNAGGPPPMRLF